jgi:putative hydrolase of the HAD superfamily
MFDFGGVISSSPFEAFSRFERENGLPAGFLRLVNSTNPHDNAWARLERGQLDLDGFAVAFGDEAVALGHPVDGRAVLALLGGDIRPAMVEAVRRCAERFATVCVTNNFVLADAGTSPEVAAVYVLFDAVIESKVVGIRKPEPRFYQLACEAVGVRPDEVVYLDDLGINLKPARAMGMRTIKVDDPMVALRELSELTGLDLGTDGEEVGGEDVGVGEDVGGAPAP